MAGVCGDGQVPDSLFRALFDAVDDVVYVVDEDGRPAFWNEALEAVTGYDAATIGECEPGELFRPLDEDVGSPAGLETHGESHEGATVQGEAGVAVQDQEGAADLEAVLDGRTDRRETLSLVTRDGEAIPHEVSGTTVTAPESGAAFRCVIARDVGDRVARERELARYETIVESVDDGVYALDEEVTFSFVNDGLCEILGVPRDELLGTDPRPLIADDDRDVAATMRERVVAGERDTGVIRATAERSDGEEIDLEARYRLRGPPGDGDFPGSAGVIRDVTERNRTERELSQQRTLLQGILNTIPDVVFAFDEEFQPLAPGFMLKEFAGYTAEEMREMDPLDVVPPGDRDDVAEMMTEAMASGVTVSMESPLLTADGEVIPYEFRATRLEDDGEVIGLVGTGRDVSRRIERERALRKRGDELATLNRITELLLGITRDLVEKSSRRDLEATVCERLAESALYRFAWIGVRELDGDRIRPRVSAGDDGGYVDAVTGADSNETGAPDPTDEALRTGEVQTTNLGDDRAGSEADAQVDDQSQADDQDQADDHAQGDSCTDAGDGVAPPPDVASVAAVPLRHGETVYGVLAVHATRADAFSEREQAGFRILGETVGFVINAVKRRKLLFADAITELELAVAGTDVLPAQLARALSCAVTLDGYVDAGERWIVYLDVADATAEAVAAWLEDAEAVEHARVVADGHDLRRLEVGLAESTLLDAAVTVGGTVTGVAASGAESRAVLAVPADVDVRETVELLTERLDGASLVAQRDRDRRADRPAAPDGLLDDLTPRQRDALAVAYRAGYFEWPRESTAEEVAATLDVAPPTLHAHLRKAEGRLLGALLDGP